LAALSFWYEFYYDVYPNKYQYVWKIKKLHEQYGPIGTKLFLFFRSPHALTTPIVRINPLQLHIHDHDYIDTIYASGNRKRDRCSWSHHAGSKTMAGSMLEAMDHDLHKTRRTAVASFFSKRSVQALEPLVVRNVEKLIQRFKDETGEKIVNLNNSYAAMTMDIISEYCFGDNMKGLERPEYGKEWLEMLHGGVQMRPIGRQFPWLVNTMFDIPPHIVAMFSKDMAKMNVWTHQMMPKIEKILAGEDPKEGQRTVFHEMRDGKLPVEEKSAERLMGESHVMLGAGLETTSRTMAVTTYYLMKDVDVGERLRDELRTVLKTRDSTASLPQLEALPFLGAVINEGLRVAHGVSSRQPRIATEEDLIYKQWTIPRGTPVMESAYLLHTDPNVFPEPFAFRPQRWLDDPELKRHLFAFSRGSRNCLGMKYVE
jgi:cytochrome P450